MKLQELFNSYREIEYDRQSPIEFYYYYGWYTIMFTHFGDWVSVSERTPEKAIDKAINKMKQIKRKQEAEI